jgi:RNA polymerase sigma-70 factor (ECF subfamily)
VSDAPSTEVRAALDAAYRRDKRRVRATLIRLLGGFDEAEEAVHEAFLAAAEQWPREGVPANPFAWLVSAGRFKTIDRWRQQARHEAALPELVALVDEAWEPPMPDTLIDDDELRLVFTCCHPALAPDARIALTLREVCGLATEEIARAYLVPTPTIAQRIVRAKAKIRDHALPYEVPARSEWPARLASVLHVVYLIFNEGYLATQGMRALRTDLCAEAMRLGEQLVRIVDDNEAQGLLALMLLHESRRAARVDSAGELVLLEDQDRSRWDRECIAQAQALIDDAMQAPAIGPYLLQAAIAAVHAQAASLAATDWRRIVDLYDLMHRADGSPVVALNRAVAVSMLEGPQRGLMAIDAVMADGRLDSYHLAHAARADMQRRLGRLDDARRSFELALKLAQQPAERRLLQRKLSQLEPAA